MTPRVSGIQVLHLESANGCRPELLELLSLWPIYGTFDLVVAEDGGYRVGLAAEMKQQHFFVTGQSKAATLRQTPHGRRCAVDCWPVGFNPVLDFASQPGMREKFLEWVEFVEEHGKSLGVISGARFKAFGADGDLPHCEVANWRRYSFPDGLPPVTPEKPK